MTNQKPEMQELKSQPGAEERRSSHELHNIAGCDHDSKMSRKLDRFLAEFASRLASTPPAQQLLDEQVEHMVNRFLAWRLPENFNPDGGISFKPTFNDHMSFGPMKHNPTGTNLFDYSQVKAMVRHMIEGMPAAQPQAVVATPPTSTPIPAGEHLVPARNFIAELGIRDAELPIDGKLSTYTLTHLLARYAIEQRLKDTVCSQCGDGLVRVHIDTGTTEHRLVDRCALRIDLPKTLPMKIADAICEMFDPIDKRPQREFIAEAVNKVLAAVVLI